MWTLSVIILFNWQDYSEPPINCRVASCWIAAWKQRNGSFEIAQKISTDSWHKKQEDKMGRVYCRQLNIHRNICENTKHIWRMLTRDKKWEKKELHKKTKRNQAEDCCSPPCHYQRAVLTHPISKVSQCGRSRCHKCFCSENTDWDRGEE